MLWYNKCHPNTVYVDRRIVPKGGIGSRGWNKNWQVRPDICASFTALPFRDNYFDLVLWDPPHLTSSGTGKIHAHYGELPNNDWRGVLRDGFNECYRVCRGAVHFKWNSRQIPLKDILALFSTKPLYRTRGDTTWSIFVKSKSMKQPPPVYHRNFEGGWMPIDFPIRPPCEKCGDTGMVKSPIKCSCEKPWD